ncbi:uncharacterized protein LOC111943378 [Cyanistes caeruleus]|uniref:uncharacterized protein LOC111943378 n=1 Tax=Cyanistes caeruleus TaxID=156563 RepID=UPI000CDADA7A|nr:uncharacterized protein LOC111943378 [Cyanistes caeruleus]
MFQRLTSLFFSDSNTPEGLEEPKPFVEEEEEEDGWLIIDLAVMVLNFLPVLAVLSTQGESKEHFPGCGCITEADKQPPGMSTTINRLISSDLEKDILVFARPTVACPEPWAGASAAEGAGEALSQEYPALCSVFLHDRTDSSVLPPAPSPGCRVHGDTALPPPSPVPSNAPDESGKGCEHPHFWCMLPSHYSTSNFKHRQPRKAPAQMLLPGRDEEGKAWEAGGYQLLDQPLKIWPLTGWS